MPPPQGSNAWSGMGVGWAIAATIVAGILVWGGVGYLVDLLIGKGRVFTAIGFVLGGFGGTYVVHLRYGRGDGKHD